MSSSGTSFIARGTLLLLLLLLLLLMLLAGAGADAAAAAAAAAELLDVPSAHARGATTTAGGGR